MNNKAIHDSLNNNTESLNNKDNTACSMTVAYFLTGKFKGGSAEEQQLSLDDLIDLLHSVDHERVVGGNGAVISDDALMALLDRSFTSKKAETAATTRAGANANRHDEVFKVLEERDVHGNVLHSMTAKS